MSNTRPSSNRFDEYFAAALTGLLASDAGGLSERLVQGNSGGLPTDAGRNYAATIVEAAIAVAQAAVADKSPPSAARATFVPKYMSKAGNR